jgi:teichuronic acid biosynthesis glycosyltransferase TuaC
MAVLLHISSNQFPNLDKQHFTKKIWVELAKGFTHYHILARSHNNRFQTSTEGNITLHLIPKIFQKSFIFFFSSFYIFFIIKKLKVTHLLAQSAILGGFSAALASKAYNLPLMTEIHGEEYFRYLEKNTFKKRMLSKVIDFSFRQSSVIRSLNTIMTNKLKKAGYIDNVVEIPNRVDLSVFNRQKENFASKLPIKLVSVGRFVKEKNYLNLIRQLFDSKLDFELTLIGGGELKSIYMDYIAEKKMQHRVILIDWVEQNTLIDLLINSDIYIQYSVSEGMPRSIIEAMALRMPVITTNVGSITGVVVNQQNGIVLENFSLECLLSAINTFKNPIVAKAMATNAFHDIKEKYEWHKVFTLYRQTLLSMHYPSK